MSNVEKISIITDNFLDEGEFDALRNEITREDFPWNYNPTVVEKDSTPSPGFFYHTAYGNEMGVSNVGIPRSPFFDCLSSFSILDELNIVVLARIRANLNLRLPSPYTSDFHADIEEEEMSNHIASQWTTSIFYINTNNGYTELESSGEKIESVANRLVSFPLNTSHRFVTQTDEQTRILINFGYLKRSTTQKEKINVTT